MKTILAAAAAWNPTIESMAPLTPTGLKFGSSAYQSFPDRESALKWAQENGMFPVAEMQYVGTLALQVAPIEFGGIPEPRKVVSRHNRASVWHEYKKRVPVQ